MANVMANDNPKQEAVSPDAGMQEAQQPYLGSWKTREAAEEGIMNLQKLLDSQGNELGSLRKMADMYQRQGQQQPQQQSQPQPQVQQGPDYGKEMKAIEKQMKELDPDEPDYGKTLSQLVMQSNQMAAEMATQKALAAAQAQFEKALNDRDVQAMHKDFYKQNPDFNTPEMQMRIQEYLANDQTGMGDPLTAYREIQRDDAMAEKLQLQQALEEKTRLLELKHGEEATGKVVVKGQSPNQKTKQPKARGADLDRGMMEVLQNMA